MLSHGVRNPLNAIKGAVVYLKNRYHDEKELLEFTEIMEDEISRLDLFITRFLSSSFLDMEMDRSDINKLLSKIESYITLQAKAAHVRLDFRYGQVAPLRLNCFHVEQAVLNVLNNAISVMPQGGDIVVESTAGEGTVFTIRLPARDRPAGGRPRGGRGERAASASAGEAEATADLLQPRGAREQVVVVEDPDELAAAERGRGAEPPGGSDERGRSGGVSSHRKNR